MTKEELAADYEIQRQESTKLLNQSFEEYLIEEIRNYIVLTKIITALVAFLMFIMFVIAMVISKGHCV